MNTAAKSAFDRAIAIVENPGRYTHAERATAARELRDLKTAMEADSKEMQQQIEAAADAVQGILDNWSSGDLADAVNTAEAWRDDVMTIFPDFDWEDTEADGPTVDASDMAELINNPPPALLQRIAEADEAIGDIEADAESLIELAQDIFNDAEGLAASEVAEGMNRALSATFVSEVRAIRAEFFPGDAEA